MNSKEKLIIAHRAGLKLRAIRVTATKLEIFKALKILEALGVKGVYFSEDPVEAPHLKMIKTIFELASISSESEI